MFSRLPGYRRCCGAETHFEVPARGSCYFLQAHTVRVQASGSRHDSRLLSSMITEVLSPGIAGRV